MDQIDQQLAEDKLDQMRHSMAHVMARAISELWPETQFGVGPSIKDGFYYDVYNPNYLISEKDFPRIEKRMKKIIANKEEFVRQEVSLEQAVAWAEEAGQKLKVELLNDFAKFGTTKIDHQEQFGDQQAISLYHLGKYTDLCRGPHVKNTTELGVFKLISVAGAYWRGKADNQQMQRIYGVAFTTEAELTDYLEMIEQAKLRDHRRLGKELDLFTFSDLVGAGLPMFTPRGTVLRDLLAGFTNQLRQEFGFEKVWIPHITKRELYEKSGHWAKFGEELFLVKSQETSDDFVLKPMNCPHHTQIYASKPRSYRDLPQRYLETTTVYRDEKTGELGGLSRVRSITQDDSHIFCTPEQIGQEIDNLIQVASRAYQTFGMKLRTRLSYRDDSDAYLGDVDLWQQSQAQLRQAVENHQMEFYEQTGEAAFYGPKIDFMASDALGREHQVATVQLDFVMPGRFGLTYVDDHGDQQTPVMIHCAILGSVERFLSVFIEHTAGWFPFWLAPEQVRILTISDQVEDYAEQVKQILATISLETPVKHNQLRFSIDDRQESLGKKIKEATLLKIPVQIIIGLKDQAAAEVSLRLRDKEEKVKLTELADYLQNLNTDESHR